MSVFLHLPLHGNTVRPSHKGCIAWLHDGQLRGEGCCKALEGLVTRQPGRCRDKRDRGLIFRHWKTLTPSALIASPGHDRTRRRQFPQNSTASGVFEG
ncbi:MAG TPA: hypothetical protein VFC43_08320, partial [Methanoregula sp.]|nr:hypothetical protein [Methanoregula sp.]